MGNLFDIPSMEYVVEATQKVTEENQISDLELGKHSLYHDKEHGSQKCDIEERTFFFFEIQFHITPNLQWPTGSHSANGGPWK